MLKKITRKEFKQLYRKHIIKDFPKLERPSCKNFIRRIEKIKEEVYIYEEENKEKAYIILNDINDYIFITFLAVYKENRGQGIGTKILKDLENKFKDKKAIIIEVENPETYNSLKEKETKERRIRFYKNLRYKVIEGLIFNTYFVQYKIMILNLREKKIKEKEIADTIYNFYKKLVNKKDMELIKYEIKD